MHQSLLNRTTSGFPVSIGTGLSLETIFDPIENIYDAERNVPEKINRTEYTNYVFNVSTLLRNILGSIKDTSLLLIPKADILETLLTEIEWLTGFFQADNLHISFYINNYNFVKQTYEKSNILRKPHTEKQLFIDSIYNYCLGKVIKEDEVSEFSNKIKYEKDDKALILTHVPWDLLSFSNFTRLDLIESHTGTVKTRKDWNTKYYPIPDKDMSFLPFMEKLLTVFGDHVMFKPASMKDRLEVYTDMQKVNANPLSTELSLLRSSF